MTGFGRGEHIGKYKHVIAEMKAVNHRYSDVLIKLPRQYTLIEERIKRSVLDCISRGRIEVYLRFEDTGKKEKEVQVDKELALAYYKALKELATITETPLDIGVEDLAELPDVLNIEEQQENLEEIWEDVAPALQQALEILLEMRKIEGAKLKRDLQEHLLILHKLHNKIEEKSPQVVDNYREKLHKRLQEILDTDQVDENRLALEVALFADKCSIDEELVRLNSHLAQFKQTLDEDNPVGRKLDFLIQEMNREVNTIGSKANDLDITQQVVEMKSEIEKLREQVQNIE